VEVGVNGVVSDLETAATEDWLKKRCWMETIGAGNGKFGS